MNIDSRRGLTRNTYTLVLADGFSAGVDPVRDRARFHVTERGVCLVTPDMLTAH